MIGQWLLKRADRRIAEINAIAHDPEPVQTAELMQLIRKAERTQFGRFYRFEKIRTVSDYQRGVPLFNYETIKTWWEHYFLGERDVTWPGKTVFWGLSSGTTSGNKLLPVTRDTIRTNSLGGMDTLYAYLHRSRDRRLLQGKMLFLGGCTTLTPSAGGTLIGDNTGIMAKHIPFYVRPFYSPGLDIALVSDWEKKIQLTIETASAQDIRLITGVPSWISLMLEKLLNYTGKKTVAEVWPNLSVYIHGGMSFTPYRPVFEALIGKPIFYVDTYTATEGGMMGIQERNDDTDLIMLMDRGVFYEFIPEDDIHSDQPRRQTIGEVEPGVNYVLAVTTNAGIWSYMIGDMIQFVSVKPHRFFFAGRTKSFLNAYGEHVIQEELETAIAEACRQSGAVLNDFTVIPFYPKVDHILPRHRWLVEFRRPPENPNEFIRAVDHYIQVRNDDYKAHRQSDFGIDAPELVILHPNSFYEWMRQKGKIGGQNKVPRVLYHEEEYRRLVEISRQLTISKTADNIQRHNL